ncbi:RIP metalloprotease RseP [soil metagenome]
MYIALAILSLGFLIIVHEGGHYFVARWCGMRVERFSLGFGPAIPGLKWKSKKTGTQFQIAPIPFGGFVEIRGMNIAEEVDPDDTFAYPNRPAWQRFITIFAGPATNYVSAMILAFCLYNCHGVEGTTHYISVEDVMPGYDALGKLEPGDRILQVDHEAILATDADARSLTGRVTAKKGAPVVLTVQRAGKQLDVSITPRSDKDDKGNPIYLLGIHKTSQSDPVQIGVLDAAGRALVYPVEQTKMILGGLYDIVTGAQKADPGGPKRIVEEFSRHFRAGFVTGIQLLMMLSVYLGLFNLLPLPALDGGRLVFLGYEMVTRRRANPKIEAMVHMGGIMVLGVLMILVTLHDFHVF